MVSWFKQKDYCRQTKDTVNYYALMNKLLEFMGHKLIQLEEKTLKYTAGEQFRLANSI